MEQVIDPNSSQNKIFIAVDCNIQSSRLYKEYGLEGAIMFLSNHRSGASQTINRALQGNLF